MKRETVLITGASRGIGRETAKLLAKENYNIVINYEKNEISAKKTFEEIKEYNSNVLMIKADIRKKSEVDKMFDEIEKVFGNVDILINNAGIANTAFFQDISEECWKDIFDVNVNGSYRCIKRAIPNMISKKYGKIIGISSIWGVTGGALEVHYSATKGAIIAMNKALAKELGYSGITVNTIAPGGVETDMLSNVPKKSIEAYCSEFPLGRLAKAIEIANVIKFLVSHNADYITGEVINVNGGAFI
ncbi:MAG: 3-oxoacyl-ACP reductase FabG [Peptoniphilaceae bacterium]|uniref:elongation factor P 5-aminopentanone reductase n=1 Tax=Parvimonas sp. TaxID=1944660 RepID=UPI0025CB8CBC|nr:3-oxoacyl-ACP reductase FabG [Parvimonas sp.]MCI5998067.1 3-oxoacyl-ACP reductase FabG [Parvimonas sp.]MDD7764687.1 3-oxoacyl-ACP reductase FabG [Peptoniphilaceae bacterium]